MDSLTKKITFITGSALAGLVLLFVWFVTKPVTYHPTFNQPSEYPNLETQVNPWQEKIYGMIVSHHHYTEHLLSEYFLKLKNQDIERVVILSPNHFNHGRGNITTGDGVYTTAFGKLDRDQEFINQLVDTGLIIDNTTIAREHGVLELVSYIEYIKPKAKIVPIVIKRQMPKAELDRLADFLIRNADDKTLVVASVDFSHHMTNDFAQFHDDLSVPVILGFDFSRVFSLEVDSRQSLYVLMKYMASKQAMKCEECVNTNYALLSKDLENRDVTSYLFAVFVNGPAEKKNIRTVMRLPQDVSTHEQLTTFLTQLAGDEGNELKGFDFAVSHAISGCQEIIPVKYAQGVERVKVMKNSKECLPEIYDKMSREEPGLLGLVFHDENLIKKYILR